MITTATGTFVPATPEVRAAVWAGTEIMHLPYRGHHFKVVDTVLGPLATANGMGGPESVARYAGFESVQAARAFTHAYVAGLIRDQAPAKDNWYFRSWTAEKSTVVEHEMIHHRWHVVIGDTVLTFTTASPDDDLDDWGGREAGWAFVGGALEAAGVPMPTLLEQAVLADHQLLAERASDLAAPTTVPTGPVRRRWRSWGRRAIR